MSVSGNKGKTLHSLEELKGIDLELELDLPEIDLKSLDPEELEAKAKLVQEKVAVIREKVPLFITVIDTVAGLSREAQELARSEVARSKEGLQRALYHKNEALRRTGWSCYLSFQFGRALKSVVEVKGLVARLVKEGYLIEVDEAAGFLRLGNRFYAVPAEAAFEAPERIEVRKSFLSLLDRVDQVEALADLSWGEFRHEKKAGKITLGVPPEPMFSPDGSPVVGPDGKQFWRPGGQLRVESDGGKVFPVRIFTRNDKLRTAIDRAVELKVHLILGFLDLDWPPKLRLSGENAAEKAGKAHLLWFLIKRAEKQELIRQERQCQREEMAEMAASLVMVSTEEFFLGHQPGICEVIFDDPWEVKDLEGNVIGTIYDLFFFPERILEEGEEGPETFISVVPERVAPHVLEYLNSFANGEKPFWGRHPEGEKFKGLPYPLSAFLQHAHGLTEKADKISNGGNGGK